jgi:hypothetical protein
MLLHALDYSNPMGTYILMGHVKKTITNPHTDIHRAKQHNTKNTDAAKRKYRNKR